MVFSVFGNSMGSYNGGMIYCSLVVMMDPHEEKLGTESSRCSIVEALKIFQGVH